MENQKTQNQMKVAPTMSQQQFRKHVKEPLTTALAAAFLNEFEKLGEDAKNLSWFGNKKAPTTAQEAEA